MQNKNNMAKKIILNIMVLTVLASLSSCLKNKFDVINPKDSPSVIEFKMLTAPSPLTPEGSLYTAYRYTYVDAPSVTGTYLVQITGPDPAPQDITVNIGVKAGAVAAFNAEKQSVNPSYVGFTDMPSSLYTIETPTVVIKAGQRAAEVKVSFKTTDFDYDKNYALPISITSTNYATVSGNFGTIFLNIGVKNAFDGVYTLEEGSKVIRYTAPGVPANDALSGSIAGNTPVQLQTINKYTVEIVGLKWAGNASGVAGIDNLRVTVNPATNLCTVFALGNGTLANTAGKTNSYDPATKTYTLNFDWGPTPREMTLILKYKED
ncbi:MAG: DUF1735 domain-containing protein [Niabella sp.]